MTFLTPFWIGLGGIFALAMVMAAWIFRTSSAPLAPKLVIPATLVALACYTPGQVNKLLGFPVITSMAGLPDRSQIVGIVPHDAQERVDLWLREGDEPRSYNLPMPPKLKEMLRRAQDAMRHGKPVMLVKGAKDNESGNGSNQFGSTHSGKGNGDPNGIGDDPHDFWLDFSDDLPPKEAGE